MIYEYAVEPTLVAQWAKAGVVGLAGQFGLDHRRIVSDFPTYWKGDVFAALLEDFGYDDSNPEYIESSNLLNALLEFMTPNMIDRAWKAPPEQLWIDQALDAHKTEPFHAILASAPRDDQSIVITSDVVNRPRDKRWYLPTVKPTAKTAADLATILETLLRGATKIVLVDPYFDPREGSYREVLTALLSRTVQLRDQRRTLPSIEIITGVAEGRGNGSTVSIDAQLANEAHNRYEWAAQHLGSCIPKSMSLTFRCIANFPHGDRLHNRFVLTDFAGASLPYGTQALGANVFDDITPLYKGQYEQRWRQFTRPDQLRVIGTPRVVESTCR